MRPITATLVRQIAAMGGDVRPFVPAAVADRLSARFAPSAPAAGAVTSATCTPTRQAPRHVTLVALRLVRVKMTTFSRPSAWRMRETTSSLSRL